MAIKSLNINVLVSLTWILSAACGRPADTSNLQHTDDEPVRDGSGWNWDEVSEADHERVVLDGAAPRGFVANTSPLVARAQYWVDKIDTLVRSRHAVEMADVPRPRVKMIKDSSFNAFVAGMYSCFNMPIEIEGRTGRRDSGLFVDLSDGGTLMRWNDNEPGFPVKCLVETDMGIIREALASFNASSNGCQLDVVGSKVVASAACPLGSDMADAGGIASGSKIVIGRTSSWINILTGLIQNLPDEQQFVSVISHELGHYYRSHITSKLTEYGYYYTLGDRNPGERPVASRDLQEFGDSVFAAAQVINYDSFFSTSIAGQKISPRLYLAAGDIAAQVCASGTCSAACQAVAKLPSDLPYKRNNGIYPFQDPPTNTAIYFDKFETNAIACLSGLRYGNGQAVTEAMVHEALAHPTWFGVEVSQSIYPEQAQQLIFETLQNIDQRATPLPASTSAMALIANLSVRLDGQMDEAKSLMADARDRKLGQYTAEQEADELAVEWTSKMGLEPDSMVKTNMTMAGMSPDDEMFGFIIGGIRCKELFDNNWVDNAGNPAFVPVGDYSEDHHSACFRAFNTQREIQAHGYVRAQGDGSTPPGGTWASIKAQASRMMRPFRGAARPQMAVTSERTAKVPAFLRRDEERRDACVFSQDHSH